MLSKIVYKEFEIGAPGKRVSSDLTESNLTAIGFYFKSICKF